MSKSDYISGIRPTGRLHLGNYIGSILPALKYKSDVLIAEYHAPTGDAGELNNQLLKFFEPKKILRQSTTFNPKLYFRLLELSPSNLLNAMPQYKAKEKTALMYIYPVLMAHDIAGYDFVIVGEDQRPHIEFADDILYRVDMKCPTPIYEGGKIMDLRDPTKKMSKSDPSSCLFLDDSEEAIRAKIRKAVTTPEGRANLDFIYLSLFGKDFDPPPKLNTDLKDAIAEELVRRLV